MISLQKESTTMNSSPDATNVTQLKEIDSTETGFDAWWKQYPRKIGKPLAKAKYLAIVSGGMDTKTLDRDSGSFVPISISATHEELMEGVKRYRDEQIDKKTYKVKDDGKYICHPATWLNQGRWMDG
jgi:hypothetical protein